MAARGHPVLRAGVLARAGHVPAAPAASPPTIPATAPPTVAEGAHSPADDGAEDVDPGAGRVLDRSGGDGGLSPRTAPTVTYRTAVGKVLPEGQGSPWPARRGPSRNDLTVADPRLARPARPAPGRAGPATPSDPAGPDRVTVRIGRVDVHRPAPPVAPEPPPGPAPLSLDDYLRHRAVDRR
jgi:hypothetical protein